MSSNMPSNVPVQYVSTSGKYVIHLNTTSERPVLFYIYFWQWIKHLSDSWNILSRWNKQSIKITFNDLFALISIIDKTNGINVFFHIVYKKNNGEKAIWLQGMPL